MTNVETPRERADRLGLGKLYQLSPGTFHAAMKSAAQLGASQPQPENPYQEPAHVCRFDNPAHTREKE